MICACFAIRRGGAVSGGYPRPLAGAGARWTAAQLRQRTGEPALNPETWSPASRLEMAPRNRVGRCVARQDPGRTADRGRDCRLANTLAMHRRIPSANARRRWHTADRHAPLAANVVVCTHPQRTRPRLRRPRAAYAKIASNLTSHRWLKRQQRSDGDMTVDSPMTTAQHVTGIAIFNEKSARTMSPHFS